MSVVLLAGAEGLQRGDFGYLGLIGSATKRARFFSRLAQRGIACTGRTEAPHAQALIAALQDVPGKNHNKVAVIVT